VLNFSQDIFLVIVWVSLSITYLILLNRIWDPSRRKAHNDVIGWQISIIGTIYAVMIGFMLYAVWSNFQTAETNSDGEANALINLFRSADGLPAQQRSAIQIAAVNYGNEVLTREWVTMGRNLPPHSAQPYIMQLWAILTQTPAQTGSQQIALSQSMEQLTTLTKHRRIRILESESAMPPILWAVLVMGGVITVISCGLIGSENIALHFALIVALSLLISLALVAIADIDQPFQGAVHIPPTAFMRAQDTMLHPGLVPK
jgi:Protein of unknown function (DUF4239)